MVLHTESSYPQKDYYTTLHPFNGLFSRTIWVSRYQKGKSSLDLNEARDDEVWGCSGISWTISKQSVPCSRQITTTTRHHSIFTGRMLFLMPNQQCQSTEGSTHRKTKIKIVHYYYVAEFFLYETPLWLACHCLLHKLRKISQVLTYVTCKPVCKSKDQRLML